MLFSQRSSQYASVFLLARFLSFVFFFSTRNGSSVYRRVSRTSLRVANASDRSKRRGGAHAPMSVFGERNEKRKKTRTRAAVVVRHTLAIAARVPPDRNETAAAAATRDVNPLAAAATTAASRASSYLPGDR